MGNVEFRKDYYKLKNNPNEQSKSTRLAGFLLDKNIANSETQANYIILGITILIIIISIFIFTKGSGDNKPQSGEIPSDQFIAI